MVLFGSSIHHSTLSSVQTPPHHDGAGSAHASVSSAFGMRHGCVGPAQRYPVDEIDPSETDSFLLEEAETVLNHVGAICSLERSASCRRENYIYHLGKKTGWCS